MKIRLTVVALLAFLVIGVSSAEAARYRMNYGQAKSETKRYAKEICGEVSECIAYAVGGCYRQSLSRFDCEMGLFYPGPEIEPAEELECNQTLHWGVNYAGYIVLKRRGQPHCFYR